MSVEEKVNYYDEANKQVAILCNHQKTVPKNFDLMKEKLGLKVKHKNNRNYKINLSFLFFRLM